HSRHYRAYAKIILYFGVLACIHGQISCREESEQHEGEHSARQRKRREPARKKTGADYPLLADANRAGSQRAEYCSLHQGRERTRNSKKDRKSTRLNSSHALLSR